MSPASAGLPAALLQAVAALELQRLEPAGAHPSLDLALVVFDAAGGWRGANVLFSREHPQGVAASVPPDAGPLQGIRFDADLRDEAGTSLAWQPGADWAALPWQRLRGPGAAAPDAPRFVAPYPASLLKLMVAVGLGLAVDRGLLPAWPAEAGPMITVSCNDATDACVAALHRCGLLGPFHNGLNEAFSRYGLPTLLLNDTTPAGGWRNADGAGVGHIHMTAWDTVRLLWLLDAAAPPAPWLPPGSPPLLQPASREHLRALLAAQQLDEILSSGRLRSEPGWVRGLPDAPVFAHKTGTTDNYASDAGIVHTEDGVHGIVAVLSSLGRRFAATPACATAWQLPALGAAVYALARQAHDARQG